MSRIVKRDVPKAWRHKEPAVTINGNTLYYWLHCQRCFKPKGHSDRRYCPSCSRIDKIKKAMDVHCPHCQKLISRNDLIRSLYMAGAASTDIGKVFGLSAGYVLVINGYKNPAKKKR